MMTYGLQKKGTTEVTKPEWFLKAPAAIKELYNEFCIAHKEACDFIKASKSLESLYSMDIIKVNTQRDGVSLNNLKISERAGRSHSNITTSKAKGLVDEIEGFNIVLNELFSDQMEKVWGQNNLTKEELVKEVKRLNTELERFQTSAFKESLFRLQDKAFLTSGKELREKYNALERAYDDVERQNHELKNDIDVLNLQLSSAEGVQSRLEESLFELKTLRNENTVFRTRLLESGLNPKL